MTIPALQYKNFVFIIEINPFSWVYNRMAADGADCKWAIDLPPESVRLVLRIYPVAGAVAKWETLKAFSKQAGPASFP